MYIYIYYILPKVLQDARQLSCLVAFVRIYLAAKYYFHLRILVIFPDYAFIYSSLVAV